MTASRIEYLFHCYVNQACTAKETAELMELLRDPANEAIFKSLLQSFIKSSGSEMQMPEHRANIILQSILQTDSTLVVPMKQRSSARVRFIKAAAAVLILISVGSIYWFVQKKELNDRTALAETVPTASPIVPGTDKAMLTMADGSTVILDSKETGTFEQPGNTKIQKQGTVLMYSSVADARKPGELSYNTLSTPRGGQYRVVLSDGTEVWLNAESSLRFPTRFRADVREVELTGEAYFEVAKNKQAPFHVKIGSTRVDVLGTHFNINAYSEERVIKTSLLEGSVRVNSGTASSRLKPGQQAVVTTKDDPIKVRTANMDAVVAWKNGLFEFEGADIGTIMRQISRWYNVEIEYAGSVPARRFEGKISRSAALSDVLKILELSNIRFKVEGQKIIIQ